VLCTLPPVLALGNLCGVAKCRYLAGSQSFQRDTEVVLLTTNLLKKEFSSLNSYDIGQALNCMMNIVNKDLARDLLPDTVRKIKCSTINSASATAAHVIYLHVAGCGRLCLCTYQSLLLLLHTLRFPPQKKTSRFQI